MIHKFSKIWINKNYGFHIKNVSEIRRYVKKHFELYELCGRFNKPSIDAACETNEDNAEHAHKDGDTLAHMALECSNGLVVGVDKHCLYHKQIVVKRNNSVNQRNEHQHIQCNRTALQCRAEDEELAKESGKRWNTCQREHGKCHGKRQFRVSLI